MTDYGEYIVSMYCAQSGVKCERIVRCKDCKYHKHNSFHRCDLRTQAVEVEPYGFCKWGERRDAE